MLIREREKPARRKGKGALDAREGEGQGQGLDARAGGQDARVEAKMEGRGQDRGVGA